MNELIKRCDSTALIQIVLWTQGDNSFNARLVAAIKTYSDLNPQETLTAKHINCAAENILQAMYEETLEEEE